MIRVKEYLDKHFYSKLETTATLKSNGHYDVIGYWEYPKGISESESNKINEHMKTDRTLKGWVPSDQMSFICNNETLIIRSIIINGESVSKYGYLQTYEHLPRQNPDANGYYVRSTDEEIIRYIDSYFVRIKNKERYWKIKRIQNRFCKNKII